MVVYVNKKNFMVFNQNAWIELVDQTSDEVVNDEDALEDFLNEHYSIVEIFRANEDLTNRIWEQFLNLSYENAEKKLLETDWARQEVCGMIDEDVDDDDYIEDEDEEDEE